MKKVLLAALAFAAVQAQGGTEIMKVVLTDGTEVTYPVGDVAEIVFEDEETSPAQEFAGVYSGKQNVTVGGAMKYDTDLTIKLTAEADGTLTVDIPEYSLSGTVMGDLTLGALQIKGLAYDEAKGGFFRDYSADGLTQHFTAVNGGNTTMDKDYVLGSTSTILIVRADDGSITVTNPFKLGAMPLPLTASFTGSK